MNKMNLEEWKLIEDKERFKEIIDEILEEDVKGIKKAADELKSDEHKKNHGVAGVLARRAKDYGKTVDFRIEVESKREDEVMLYNDKKKRVTLMPRKQYKKRISEQLERGEENYIA